MAVTSSRSTSEWCKHLAVTRSTDSMPAAVVRNRRFQWPYHGVSAVANASQLRNAARFAAMSATSFVPLLVRYTQGDFAGLLAALPDVANENVISQLHYNGEEQIGALVDSLQKCPTIRSLVVSTATVTQAESWHKHGHKLRGQIEELFVARSTLTVTPLENTIYFIEEVRPAVLGLMRKSAFTAQDFASDLCDFVKRASYVTDLGLDVHMQDPHYFELLSALEDAENLVYIESGLPHILDARCALIAQDHLYAKAHRILDYLRTSAAVLNVGSSRAGPHIYNIVLEYLFYEYDYQQWRPLVY